MKPRRLFLPFALLAFPVVQAEPAVQDAPWLAQEVQSAEAGLTKWLKESKGVAEEYRLLGIPEPQRAAGADDALPESTNGDAVAVCDGGLLFNAESYDMVYVHNVRLKEARLHLRAANRLFIRMQRQAAEKGRDEAQEGVSEAAKGKSLPLPQQPAKEAPAAQPAASAEQAETPAAPAEPLDIRTFDAVADTNANTIILYSPQGEAPTVVCRGENRLQLTPFADRAAVAVADAAGNVLMQGQVIDMHWVDAKGTATALHSTGGVAYYRAATGELVVAGPVEIQQPNAAFTCAEGLTLRFLKAEGAPAEPAKGFMRQFANMKLGGLARLTARGTVRGRQTVEGTERSVAGDHLVYDAESGDCRLNGADCRLCYGASTLISDEGMHLLPNGDIELLGNAPHGTYERPAPTKGTAPLAGTFQAHSPLYFHADTGTLTAENGLQLADAGADFSCTGAVELKLTRRAGAAETKHKGTGNLNLAAASFGEPESIRALGTVLAHRYDPAAGGKCTGLLSGEMLDANLTTGAATLTGTTDIPAVAELDGNHLEAVADADTVPTLHFAENGDVELTGGRINAALQTKDGVATAHCRSILKLTRATAMLETGSETDFRTPHAIVTTRGPLTAHLAEEQPAAKPAEGATKAPESGRWPQHRFNYIGIDSARTEQGGTVQTAKGSMQCTGPIALTLDPKAKDGQMAGLKTARATGNVAVAGRDTTGRIIRATGDVLTMDAATGIKRLTGGRVTLADEYNTHTATGSGAAVIIDAKNNARITGSKQTTTATHIREQVNKQQEEAKKPADKKKKKP